MSQWPDPTPGICDNCGASLRGEYCHVCGQHERSYIRNVFSLISEVLAEFSSWDSRVLRTLVPLLFRPAYLSNEYIVGRRVRYVPPIRLYLFVSLIFFLTLTFVARIDPDSINFDGDNNPVAEVPTENLPPEAAAAIEQANERAAERAAAREAEQAESDQPLPECTPGNVSISDGRPGQTMEDRVCVDIPWLSEATNEYIRQQFVRVATTPELAFQQARQLAPVMMFFLLPLFAVILKVLYLFSKRYYTEHLTLALHTHSFLFLAFLLMLLFSGIGDWADATQRSWIGTPVGFLGALLMLWIPVYLFLAQKWFYGQGFLMTSFKYLLTGFVYMTMVGFTAVALVFASILSA